ncbi:MAG: PTS sugar transporter subunit IIA [Chloroflexi bacterium]|nr:PTS sugar transporter subunit IIA [Chloroflexota bacterium]
MLLDYLKPDLVLFHVNANTWQNAVQIGGGLLVEHGICTPAYVDACMRAAIHMGPYMVLSPGIALAHSRPEDGALAVGLSIITLDPPVNFGNKSNDPVRLLITFCGIDHSSHITMLQELATFLMDEKNQQFLLNATNITELTRYLQNSKG